MGATVGIRDPYDYSISTEENSNGKKNKSLSPPQGPTGYREDYYKLPHVRANYLAVPCYEGRHPFQDFRLMKKLGE